MGSYELARKFLKKYPFTIAWRVKQHCKIIDKHLNPGEKILYLFVGQKNDSMTEIFNTNAVALTDKRIMVGTKRVLFGYFFKSITPDMYNDLTISANIFWGKVIIDTVKEKVFFKFISKSALPEIETEITSYMMEQKKLYEEVEVEESE